MLEPTAEPAVVEPYALVSPYWNAAVADELFGVTVDVSVAPVAETEFAPPVVTVGGTGDEEHASEMAFQGRQRVMEWFSFHRQAEQYLELLSTLCPTSEQPEPTCDPSASVS